MMSSIMSSQGVVLATAMAVSGTLLLLALRLHNHNHNPPSRFISSSGKKKCEKRRKKKKKKKVQFAEDVVDPIGNSEEYRKQHKTNSFNKLYSNSTKVQQMPANRVALYDGILRDRLLHKVAYSC